MNTHERNSASIPKEWLELGVYMFMKVKVKVTQSCPTLCDPMDCTVHWILQARILEWVSIPFSRGSSQPRDQSQVSIAGRFFTSWVTRKSKNTGVGSLSLLQWIILTQESNWSFLHCTQILYQLSFIGLCCCCCCCWVASVVSDSGRPYRWQPTRLPCPWDSPGKNTGVGCTSFSTAWKWKVKVKSLSHVQLFATPWTAAHQGPLSMGFSRQEYWSGVIGLYSILIMNNEFVEKC